MAPAAKTASTPPLRLYLLGAFRLERGPRTIQLSTHKAESLLAYLALHPEKHPREKLAARFWGDSPEAQARHSLRSALTALRKTLGDEVILTDREIAQLNPDYPLWVDAREFQIDGTNESAIGNQKSKIELYEGDLLSDFYDDWILLERERLRALYLGALLQIIQQLRTDGQYAQVIEWAQKVLVADPANEKAYQHLIFCYASLGERSTALKQYETCRRVLREELNAEPSSETTALYQRIKQELAGGKAPEAVSTNLPVPLTSFIGRQQELAKLKELLVTARLLTLTGIGGSGKTRLAIQLATDLVKAFRFLNGAWWVDLSGLNDATLVSQTVATVLGLRESQGVPLTTVLTNFLRAKELLLVLDNCEHLIEACARLAEILLSACPQLQILATSREALGLTGEVVWRVPTLAVPDTAHLPPVEQFAQYDAVRLFAERATAALTNWTLAANAAPVAQICARLDGIPLAIELAAARVPALSAQQIAARLDDRFHLLTSGSRTALPRQQTLRATMDWSYELLLEPERALLRRLSVFAGGWTLEAAELVCGDAGAGLALAQPGQPHGLSLRPTDVLDLLTQLVNKSLVLAEEQNSETRYRFLETIRQYADEKLLESGEEASVRSQHLDFYVRWTEQAEPLLGGAEQIIWLNRLETEHDNLRAALGWSLAAQDRVELGLRLAGAIGYLWVAHDHHIQAWAWIERLLNRSRGAPTAARAKVLTQASFIRMQLGELAPGRTLAQEGLTIYRALIDQIGIANALRNLGNIVLKQGDDAQARLHFEESLAIGREVGDQQSILWGLFALGHLAFARRDYAWARSFYEESLAIARARGMKWGVVSILKDLGDLAYRQNDYATAEAMYAESLAMNWEVDRADHPWESAWLLSVLGRVALHQGHPEQAGNLLKQSLTLFQNMEDWEGIGRGLESLAVLVAEQKQAERAGRLFGAVAALFESFHASGKIDAFEPERYYRALAMARAQLGEAMFNATWTEGRAMTMEQAIEYALGSVQTDR